MLATHISLSGFSPPHYHKTKAKFSVSSASLAGKSSPGLFSMAHIALFLCTTGCFSILPSTRNNTGVYFRLGRSFQDLAVLTAVH